MPPGHSHNWATVIGGPVRAVKFDGRDRLLFFFSYNGFKDVRSKSRRRSTARRIDSLRGDHMHQLDLSLARNFKLSSSTRFEVQVQAINALNRVQWDRPGTNPVSSNFGVVTQQWNTPRWIQLQGRFTF